MNVEKDFKISVPAGWDGGMVGGGGRGGEGGLSHFWIICPIWMNNPSLESCYVVLFKYYATEHHSCDTCVHVSYFSVISGKIRHVASFNIIWRLIAKFLEKKIGNVQCILEEVLIYFCVGWILFWVSYGNEIKKNLFE